MLTVGTTVVTVQLNADKFSTTRKASAFMLYPFHGVFLNFDESVRRKLVSAEETVVGYVPC